MSRMNNNNKLGVQGLGIQTGTGAGRYGDGSFIKNGFGNGDLIKAVTIASGGLSGGISSTIAGGNFWAGARQCKLPIFVTNVNVSIFNYCCSLIQIV